MKELNSIINDKLNNFELKINEEKLQERKQKNDLISQVNILTKKILQLEKDLEQEKDNNKKLQEKINNHNFKQKIRELNSAPPPNPYEAKLKLEQNNQINDNLNINNEIKNAPKKKNWDIRLTTSFQRFFA